VTLPTFDNVFCYQAVPLKFGRGVAAEVGEDARALGIRRAMLVTDPHVAATGLLAQVANDIARAGVAFEVYDRVACEPTEASWLDAIAFARQGSFDGFVALGGGSCIDTAKAANLGSTYPADLRDYIHRPVGNGKPVPGPLKPLIALPTTAGTASECTSVAVVGIPELRLKTGISHRFLRPALAILDPLNTRTCPPAVTASCGIDVICHAAESFTAIPYDRRPRPEHPSARPPYIGANPISDLWSAQAISLAAQYLPRAVANGLDEDARWHMLLACTYAGMGFGNAGVHMPHAMAYPIAGQVRDFIPRGYPDPHPMIPHGISVTLGAPAAFRFTAAASPEKHLEAARLMGCNVRNARPDQAGDILAGRIIELMRQVGLPSGLEDVGYTDRDTPALADAALQQTRLLAPSPRVPMRTDMERIFADARRYW
jgi:hydroxyacid-oxoacid transhydrogenase